MSIVKALTMGIDMHLVFSHSNRLYLFICAASIVNQPLRNHSKCSLHNPHLIRRVMLSPAHSQGSHRHWKT